MSPASCLSLLSPASCFYLVSCIIFISCNSPDPIYILTKEIDSPYMLKCTESTYFPLLKNKLNKLSTYTVCLLLQRSACGYSMRESGIYIIIYYNNIAVRDNQVSQWSTIMLFTFNKLGTV